ncbi:MAG: hypothetical protein AAB699_00745 [Patescibacteria group bacterium]
MRLFLIEWTGASLGMVAAARELARRGHEILYWSGVPTPDEADPRDFPGTIFHERGDALFARPAAALKDISIPPLGEDVIRSFSETESETLTMMNKLFAKMQVSERKHLYYQYLSYWHAVLEKMEPDAILFPTIPHTVYDFVLYRLAKRQGLLTVMLEPTWIGDRLVVLCDYERGSERVAEEMKKARSVASPQELAVDLQEEYRLQRSRGRDATPIFVKNIRRKYSLLRLPFVKLHSLLTTLRAHKDPSVLLKAATFPFRAFRPNLKKEYERVSAPPDFTKPYVYFPLHYQPERNSSPQGGRFVDQLYLASVLSASLPAGWSAYLKEHPTQWFSRGASFSSYRFKGFYETLARMKNIRIVPIETSTYRLTEGARAVATITGTAGWEALLRQKPVLAFGYPWYQHCPGVARVRDTASCASALERVRRGWRPVMPQILAYLAAFERASFHGYIDADGQKVSKLSAAENARSLAEELNCFLARFPSRPL